MNQDHVLPCTQSAATSRRAFLSSAASAGALPLALAARTEAAAATNQPASPATAIDFSRSFSHYTYPSPRIWVRIQVECRLELFDRTIGQSDEYLLSVRTQTGLRTKPPSDKIDPGYDFWMIFSKNHVLVRRVHASSYTFNPSRFERSTFVDVGWHLERCPAQALATGAAIKKAMRAWQPVVARTEFLGAGGKRGFAIEYPVKWGDGNDDNTFRVETGPVLLLDPEKAQVGKPLKIDDFQWAYLDYHSFNEVRCFLERPTSILSAATYREPNRRNPPLTEEQLARIEARLFTGWEPPIPVATLRKLLETDHYSGVKDPVPAVTRLYALEQH